MAETKVTGSDANVTVKALAYAIATIDQQSLTNQQVNDREDMVALLQHLVPDEFERGQLANTVENHTGLRPALWPIWHENH